MQSLFSATPNDRPLPRALDLLTSLQEGSLSAEALLNQTYQTIERWNPAVNAICTLLPLEAVQGQAREIDRLRARSQPVPPLAGIPIAVKDLAATAGIRTTLGTPLMKDNVPATDCLLVARLRAAGAIIIGKTNTPELGAGSHTFNPIFGTTRNPYNFDLIAGGSSGGAAAALATGMLCLADGSDMGGSLRNPAAYCNVVGMRPTMGRIPTWPQVSSRFARMAVEGPMARTVEDCTLLLRLLSGPDARDPRSLHDNHGIDEHLLERDTRGVRIGWSAAPAGLAMEPALRSLLEQVPETLARLGSEVEATALTELVGAMDIFKTLRAAAYAMLAGDLYQRGHQEMKPTLAENIKLGFEQTTSDIYTAEKARTAMTAALAELFERYDYLVMPTTQVMPFPVELEYPSEIDGEPMHSYIDWMAVCCILSPFDVPCASVPAGFSAEGIPFGIQIVGRPGDDQGVMQMAYAWQQQTQHWRTPPTLG